MSNLGFYSRKPPIATPLAQNPLGRPTFDAKKTYVALVVGDGDSIRHMEMYSRVFFLDRVARCNADPKGCFPLLWSLSPQLMRLAPDWLRWYYAQASLTKHDYFVLPASGDVYSYPALFSPENQARYVASTERDCRLMNTSATVDWEWADTWPNAEKNYFPRYSVRPSPFLY